MPRRFVESELWPNCLPRCRRGGIPLMLVNARMSARSFAALAARCPGWRATLLGGFALVQAQRRTDARAAARPSARRAVDAPAT